VGHIAPLAKPTKSVDISIGNWKFGWGGGGLKIKFHFDKRLYPPPVRKDPHNLDTASTDVQISEP
jgi:hypothetical protein